MAAKKWLKYNKSMIYQSHNYGRIREYALGKINPSILSNTWVGINWPVSPAITKIRKIFKKKLKPYLMVARLKSRKQN